MTFIPCVECGRELSDKARACPDCGAPVLPPARTAAPRTPRHAPTRADRVFRLVLAAILTALAAGALKGSEPGLATLPLLGAGTLVYRNLPWRLPWWEQVPFTISLVIAALFISAFILHEVLGI